MRNLVVIHLESISNQTMATFGRAFPATEALAAESVRFDRFFASATSSLMVLASLWHGNSFELDHGATLDAVRPAGLNRNMFSILGGKGWQAHALCLNTNHRVSGSDISLWPGELRPVWGTDDADALLARFDAVTDNAPFAVYFWNLLTHISNNTDATRAAGCLSGQQEGKYRATDALLGEMAAILGRKGLADSTVLAVFGDHGDDFWAHGFNSGFVHAVGPYTSVLATPMFIRAPGVAPFRYARLASTVDIRNTVLGLLGVAAGPEHPGSGLDLLGGSNGVVFAQNLLANQAYDDRVRIYKSYAAINDTHILVASSRGLELYDHQLDPANGCNLLHLFRVWRDGTLHFDHEGSANDHLKDIFLDNRSNLDHIEASLCGLHASLEAFVRAKNARADRHPFDTDGLFRVNRKGYLGFYDHREGGHAGEQIVRALRLVKASRRRLAL